MFQINKRFSRSYHHQDGNAMLSLCQNIGFSFFLDLPLLDLLCWWKEHLHSGKKSDHVLKNCFHAGKTSDHTKRLFLQADFIQVRVISDATLSHQDQELVLQQRTVLNLDRSERLNESSIVGLIQSLMPNVPIQLWHENKEKHWFSKTSCGRWDRIKCNSNCPKLPVSSKFKKAKFLTTTVHPWALKGDVFRCVIVDIFYVFIWKISRSPSSQMFLFTKFSNVLVPRFPNVLDLRYNSKYWQQFDTPK